MTPNSKILIPTEQQRVWLNSGKEMIVEEKRNLQDTATYEAHKLSGCICSYFLHTFL